jgi:hypothetical protein
MLETVSSVKGFLSISILSKRFHLFVGIWIITCVGGLFWLSKTSLFEEGWMKYAIGVGLFPVCLSILFYLATKSHKEKLEHMMDEQDILKEGEKETKKFDADLAYQDKQQEQIGEVMAKIREWVDNPPNEIRNREYPYNYGVKLEYKMTKTGVKSAILHVEGRPTEKYRLN